jgi:hypothetical protein
MGTTLEIKKKNIINEQEFRHMTDLMFNSFLVTKYGANKSFLGKQALLIELFTNLINKYLELQILTDKKGKLEFINFIDKLNLQKELIELEKGITDIKDIKQSAQRLGRKAQSAFKTQ